MKIYTADPVSNRFVAEMEADYDPLEFQNQRAAFVIESDLRLQFLIAQGASEVAVSEAGLAEVEALKALQPAKWLFPANSTLIPPPQNLESYHYAFLEKGTWVIKPWYKDVKVWDCEDCLPLVWAWASPGDRLDEFGYTLLKPPSKDHVWSSGEWVLNAEKKSASLRKSKMLDMDTRLSQVSIAVKGKLLQLTAENLGRVASGVTLGVKVLLKSPDGEHVVLTPEEATAVKALIQAAYNAFFASEEL